MTKPSEFEKVDSFCLPYLEERMSGVEVTSAHTQTHLLDVASLADLAAQIRQYPLRTRLLLRIASLMHDVQRLPTEDPKVNDEQLSAQSTLALMETVNGTGIFPNTFSERSAVASAIENHGKYPDRFKDKEKRESPPQTLEEQLWESLFLGDKMTQNGVWVIARRSAFVAGDRLQPGGDLQNFGFQPKSATYRGDEEMVVICESALRLTFVNPQGIYPRVFKPIVDPLYSVQREFVLGLCKANGMDPFNIAEVLLERRRPDGKNMLAVRGINYSEDTMQLAELISRLGRIKRATIIKTSDERAFSAAEAVAYFSSRHTDDLVKTALAWRPKGRTAQKWQKGMVKYLDGSWYREIEEKING